VRKHYSDKLSFRAIYIFCPVTYHNMGWHASSINEESDASYETKNIIG